MFLVDKRNSDLVEVLDLNTLFNPKHANVVGRYHAGEELQDPEQFSKSDLAFQSGEALPGCWINENYRG